MRCISNQKITPQKSEMMKAFSAAQLAERIDGKGGRAAASHSFLLFSLWGLRWVSRLCLFLLSSCLNFWLSYSLCCFSSLNPFLVLPHPLFIPPYPVCGLSQGLNLWLWSYRNIGMPTHALLCFVSLLACWLAHWLCSCVSTVCTLSLSKNVFLLSLFPVSLFFPVRRVWLLVCLLLPTHPHT